jgi:hypothetical protein
MLDSGLTVLGISGGESEAGRKGDKQEKLIGFYGMQSIVVISHAGYKKYAGMQAFGRVRRPLGKYVSMEAIAKSMHANGNAGNRVSLQASG